MPSNIVKYLNTMPEHRKRECARLTGKAARHFYEDPQNIAEFEAWLVEYRKTHPKEEAAKSLGVTDAAVCQWETGKTAPTARLLPKVAKLYGCTIDELLREDEDESGNERL